MDMALPMAQRSLKWHDEELYSFIWEHEAEQTDTRVGKLITEMVFVKYDRENEYAILISYHPPDARKEIYQFIHGTLNPWIKETHIVDEESWD